MCSFGNFQLFDLLQLLIILKKSLPILFLKKHIIKITINSKHSVENCVNLGLFAAIKIPKPMNSIIK